MGARIDECYEEVYKAHEYSAVSIEMRWKMFLKMILTDDPREFIMLHDMLISNGEYLNNNNLQKKIHDKNVDVWGMGF